MSKLYRFLFLLSLIILSTFFAGCKPQEEPIISLADDVRQSIKNAAEGPMNVTLKGTAFLSNGLQVTNKFSISVLPINQSKKYNGGRVDLEAITPDSDGSYEFSDLRQGFFQIYFISSDYKSFETNLFLTPPHTELNFSFSEITKLKLQGKVINLFNKEPLLGVTVHARPWPLCPAYDKAITDSEGKFSLELKASKAIRGYFGAITIDQPGFDVKRIQINESDRFSTITISLIPSEKSPHHMKIFFPDVVEADNDNFIPTGKSNITEQPISRMNLK